MGRFAHQPVSVRLSGCDPVRAGVAAGPQRDPFQSLSMNGPIARNVLDVALMLDAEVGGDARFPLALEAPLRSFQEAALNPLTPPRIGFTPDLGIGPVDPEVAEICRAGATRFAEAGAIVEESTPDFSGALDTFQTLRASAFVVNRAPLLEKHRDKMKPEMIWNIEKGMAQSSGDLSIALRERGCALPARLQHGLRIMTCLPVRRRSSRLLMWICAMSSAWARMSSRTMSTGSTSPLQSR